MIQFILEIYAILKLGLKPTPELHDIVDAYFKESILSKGLEYDLCGIHRIVECERQDEDCILAEMKILTDSFEIHIDDSEELLLLYVRFISKMILQRSLSPEAGARDISQAVRSVEILNCHTFDTFIYASSEMQSRPEYRAKFEKAIIEEASSFSNTVFPMEIHN